MSDNFDIGPLTWVQDDINQSLDSVLESVVTFGANPSETEGLRLALTHLYQASGALDMVGLEGCKLFCSYLEKLAIKLEKKELEATSEIIEAFTKAIKTLKYYIQELLNGSADIPLRLYPLLQPVVIALDETVNESQLFFPDTSSSVPKDVASQEFSDEEYLAFVAQQRAQYQRSFLNWMQGKEGNTLTGMVEALSNVTSAQHKPNVKTLWWAASAFVETLELPIIADNLAAKKICRRLDQELRQLSSGESKPNPELLRDILYYVAISDIDKETVSKVKETFSLDSLVENKTATHAIQELLNESELETVKELTGALKTLREIWEGISHKIDFEKLNVNEEAALVELDNVLVTKFTDALSAKQSEINTLSQLAVAGLFNALLETSIVLRDDESKATQFSLIEVATALHLLDSALANYQNIDANMTQYLHSEIETLQAIAIGDYQESIKNRPVGGLDRDTVAAVVKDINASLKVVEQSLDAYFRNSADKTTLSLAPIPLKQMASIFNMLSVTTPTQILQACGHYIQYFQQDDYQENQDDFELIAESLSMIGLYTNEMPNIRAESSVALDGALERLNASLALTGIKFVNEEVEAIDLAEPTVQQEASTVEDLKVGDDETVGKLLDKVFDEELGDIYLTEAEEVLATIAQNLQALRVNATDQEPLVELRRGFHTLKGSGRTVGLFGQAQVAEKVETFLNEVLDKKTTLNPVQITKLEKITSAFASWARVLRANNEVNLDLVYWLDQTSTLSRTEQVVDSTIAENEEKEDYVLIGGSRKLGRQLYDIFLNESMQNISILEQDVAKVTESAGDCPSKKALHAVHTLANNALAVGFTPMGNLGRSLENWLDTGVSNWVSDNLTLYSNATKEIAKMWQAASELKNPRAARVLIKLLEEESEKASQNKEHVEVNETGLNKIMEAENGSSQLVFIEPVDDEKEFVETIEEQAVDLEIVDFIPSSNTPTTHENPELLALFTEEANEILPQIGRELRAWKSKPSQKGHSGELQRLLHTLKGSARMAAQVDTGNIAHGLEAYIVSLNKKKPSEVDFETMFLALDKMSQFFDDKVEEVEEVTLASVSTGVPIEANVIDEDIEHITRATDRKAQVLRLRAEVLDRLINEAGEVSIIRSRIDREMVGFKRSSHDLTDSLVRLRSYLRELEIEAESQMQSRMNTLQETDESFDPLEFDRFTRLQELTRMIAESVNDVGTIQTGLLTNLDQTEAALQQQNRMSRDLQQGLLGIRMLPFQRISERMQRIVRQTGRELNKSVDLVIEGEATEIDRSVLDRIGAPLEHLLRNSVAHGIEAKPKRKADGKPEKGVNSNKVLTVNDETHITVNDDGAGVDLEKVKVKAINNNLLDANADITETALLSAIFEPGFSTADTVSQIAGRGVGLDVVRNDISSLGGRIDMASETGKGTTFNIYLPVTQSVAQVLLVRTADDTYALPVAMIEQAQKIKRDELLSAYADGKVEWGGVNYPIHQLAKLLDREDHQPDEHLYASVLLLRNGVHTLALHVDEVIGNQEIVMKEIGPQLSRVPGIVGATVSGDGDIILIINPVQIANREVLSIGSVGVKNVKTKAKKRVKKIKALVVDDSLTMRKVLGRLLEREGYEVQLANDGMDAMELLQMSTPDIILTDIEMPRMDGFGLSRNVRDDERTKRTPLIMISSRTADKHQNLAKEIGVDTFFGKPVQDEELVKSMKELLKRK